jgi:hypothetical protein
MESLRNGLVLLWALAMLSTVSYAQSFNNVPVDVGSGDQSETSIALDPNKSDTLMATWNDFSNGSFSQPGYAFSTDGGKSWINQGILQSGLSPSNGSYEGGFDPSCAIDASGREYYTFVNKQIANSNFFGPGYSVGEVDIEYTDDNGLSWSGPFPVNFDATEDKPYMAVDNSSDSTAGRTYVAWTHLLSNKSGSEIYFAFPINQNDLSGGWVSKIISGNNGELITGAVPAVGPHGTVYVAYDSNANNSGTSYIDVAMSTDGGNNFSDKSVRTFTGRYQQPIGNLRVSSFPTIAVDPQNSEVYVAWTEEDNGTMDTYFTHTTGAREITSWSTPQIATQTTTSNQFFPWLTINSAGHISLVYYQENASNDVDVYSAQSYDGQSFVGQDGTGEDVKLTSVSSNPTVGSLTSDYIGVTSDGNGKVHALWTDFRSGSNEDIYCANYNQQPTVTLTGPTYIDAGGSGAYYLVNGSQSSQITVDLGTSITLQSVPQNSSWAFAGWNFGSYQNPVTYYPGDNVSLSANLKELQHSMDASAYSDNSQHKLVRTSNGWLHQVYSDGGHVYYEYSPDGGTTWHLGNNGSLDVAGGKSPSID